MLIASFGLNSSMLSLVVETTSRSCNVSCFMLVFNFVLIQFIAEKDLSQAVVESYGAIMTSTIERMQVVTKFNALLVVKVLSG